MRNKVKDRLSYLLVKLLVFKLVSEVFWTVSKKLAPRHVRRQDFEEHSIFVFSYSLDQELSLLEQVVNYQKWSAIHDWLWDKEYGLR